MIGDFNARTNGLDDNLTREKHEEFLSHDFYSRIKSQRNNQDKSANNYGKKLTDFCAATRSYIVNGRTLGDFQGKLTCHQLTGSSTVDYAIVSENLEKHIKSFLVLDPNTGSDHSPIKLELNCSRSPEPNKITTQAPPYRWNDITQHLFQQKINSDLVSSTIDKLGTKIDVGNNDIDSNVEDLKNIFKTSLENSKSRLKNKKRHIKKPKKAWYDKSCYEIGKRLQLVAKLVSNSPNDPYLRGSLVKTRKEYKKLLKFKKREWKKSMIQKLEQIEEKDPKEYWKMVNEMREKKNSESSISDVEYFTNYFEKLFAKTNPVDHEAKEKFVEEKLNEFDFQKEADFTIEEIKSAIKLLKKIKLQDMTG